MNNVSQQKLELLWHTLGLSAENRHRRTVSRNYFLTSPGCSDARQLDVLVAAGLMSCGKPPAFCPQDEVVYRATSQGQHFAETSLPPLPKLTRYDEFLDADSGLEFHEWLGIEKPTIEHRCKSFGYSEVGSLISIESGCRMSSSRATGEWCKTKKDAKASYKAALAASKAHRAEAA